MQPIQLEDDGFIHVKVGEAELQLDLYQVHNQMVELQRRLAGKPTHELHQAIVDMLREHGLTGCSHRLADRFAVAVSERVAALDEAAKKKGPSSASASPTPDSAGSTVPPS
jgi:hypothetical protein